MIVSSSIAAEPEIHRDLAYTQPADASRRLDVYAPSDGQKRPVLVWIHGGGWTEHVDNRLYPTGLVGVETQLSVTGRLIHAPPGEKANLLAVTQLFSFLRYNDLGLLTVLGGKNVMLEIPFVDEIVMEKTRETARETAQQYIVTFLAARFGDVSRANRGAP